MIVVEKRNYSVNPWRLVNTDTGEELFWRLGKVTDSSTTIWVSGFPTKQAAIEGMGRMLHRLIQEASND